MNGSHAAPRQRAWREPAGAVIATAMLALVVAGCAGQPVQFGSFARKVAAEEALLLPAPGGPGIVSVIERRYDNALEQDIHLATSARTPGQNAFNIRLFGTSGLFTMGSNSLAPKSVTEAGIASEMRQSLPGLRMVRSRFFVQNGYGPFGYAFGRGSGDDLCLYAWQQIRSPEGAGPPIANFGSIQVRLRFCQADATEEQLLAIMYHFTITGAVDAGGWNPYGAVRGVSPDLGGVGAPIHPRAGADEPIVSVLPRRDAPARVKPAPARSTPRAAATRPVRQSQTAARAVPGPVPTVPGPFAAAGTATTVRPQAASEPPQVPSPFVFPQAGSPGDPPVQGR